MTDEVRTTRIIQRNNFLQRFKGKTNKVSILGIHALLLSGQSAHPQSDIYSFDHSSLFSNQSPLQPSHKSRIKLSPLPPPPSLNHSKSLQKQLVKPKALSVQLKRQPSQKLPLIGKETTRALLPIQRKMSLHDPLQYKLLGNQDPIDRSTSKNGSKYSNWKYPIKLNQNALRFFEFSEGERALITSRKFNFD